MTSDLNQLLVYMVEHQGTVLHLVPGSPPLVKTPLGNLAPLVEEVLSPADVQNIFEAHLTDEQKEILIQTKELNTTYSVPGVDRFRANIFYQRHSLSGVFRLAPPKPPEFDSLGLPSMIKEIVSKPQGLILITGPKGSGKSQTMAALIDYLLTTRSVQVVSIENPIEYLFKNKKGVVYQREVGTDTQSFKQALQTALRHDPDVLALSELPDLESTLSVLSAASAGQLVILSSTANGIIMALEQIIEQAPQSQQYIRSQLSASLELGVAQLLLKNLGGSGYVLAAEILLGTAPIKNIIREGKISQLLPAMNNARDIGMVSQELALKNLTKKNLIDPEEAMSKSVRPEELKRFLALQI